MKGVTYAYLGPEDQATKFAKKGTATDITLFNAKSGDAHLNLVAPTRYPDKLPSLLCALDLADEIILHPARIDRNLGETVVGAELFDKVRGFLRPGPEAPLDAVRPLLAKTALKDLEPNDEPDGSFRERLYTHAAAPTGGPLVLPVDHAFPVKGVGTVILGLVRSGTVSSHDTLQAYPGTTTLDVRSIQVHDVDQTSAGTRSRVGLAVKGVEAADVGRGTVLAPPGSLRVAAADAPLSFPLRPSPFAKSVARPGAVFHLFHCLQDVPLRIETTHPAADGTLAVTGRPAQPIAVVPGQPAVLVDLDNKAQRFVGRALLDR